LLACAITVWMDPACGNDDDKSFPFRSSTDLVRCGFRYGRSTKQPEIQMFNSNKERGSVVVTTYTYLDYLEEKEPAMFLSFYDI